jgi:hypothetical protein
VGTGKYTVALSADHGVCPLPEIAAKAGKTAGRVEPELLTTLSEDFLNKKFLPPGKKAPWFEPLKRQNAWVYFNHAVLDDLKLRQPVVERALVDWLKTQPGIEDAFARTDVLDANAEADRSPVFKMVKRSFHPDCSGDVMVILKPYHIFSPPNLSENPKKNPNYRASHGMPHEYDTHVPLLVMGPRVEPGMRETRIAPQAMASILAEALGVPAPKDADYPTPAGLFKK